MQPINFPQANHHYEAKLATNEDPGYDALDVALASDESGHKVTVSCHKPSFLDKVNIFCSDKVWLLVSGEGTPPISLQGFDPFLEKNMKEAIQDTYLEAQGIFEILAERLEVIATKGHTVQQDACYNADTLVSAAIAYLGPSKSDWPFNEDLFKPRTEKENLIRAAQFIAARIDVINLEEREAKEEAERLKQAENEV